MDWEHRLDTMVAGYRDAMILVAALKTGIFEALGEDARTPAEVAAACGLDARAVDVVLHALGAVEVLQKDGERFAIAPGARPHLLRDGARTMVSILGHNVGMMRAWAQLPEILRTGEPASRPERSEEELRDFILGMENVSRASSVEVAAKIDLSGVRRLLDLGGGPATAAITFCRAHPGLEAVVFDLPAVLQIAAEQIAAADLSDRITTRGGDFLVDDYGTGYDAVYVSNVIHMLAPAQTAELLRRCHACLVPGGQVLIKEFFLDDDRLRPAFAAQFSVNMLTATAGGKSYTLSETRELLRSAGFGRLEETPVATRSLVLRGFRES